MGEGGWEGVWLRGAGERIHTSLFTPCYSPDRFRLLAAATYSLPPPHATSLSQITAVVSWVVSVASLSEQTPSLHPRTTAQPPVWPV